MANRNENQYLPDYVSSPGETLLEILQERRMSQVELARRMGRPNKTINEIIHGKAAITPETARQLEHVLGVPASFWDSREQAYRAFLAIQAEHDQLQHHVAWANQFPLNAMAKYGWIKRWTDGVEQVRELLRFFGVASPTQWYDYWASPQVAYRRSQAFESQPHALAAWLRQGELLAQQLACKPHDAGAFRAALNDIRLLTTSDLDVLVPSLQAACAAVGVAVVFVPEIDGVRVSGATRWLNSSTALIQLSLRYRTDDQLWFSFFHEAGHILLHGKRSTFIEDDQVHGKQEDEANQFAAEILIPQRALQGFVDRQIAGRYPSTQSIVEFASEQGIAAGIVAGQLQHQYPAVAPQTHYNGLKRRFIDNSLPSASAEANASRTAE